MQTLVDKVIWKAIEQPSESRGMVASSAGLFEDKSPFIIEGLSEECLVMTRRQKFFLFNLSRTSVLQDLESKKGGIFWWRTSDESLLEDLHSLIVLICSEVGFSEIYTMCSRHGPSVPIYWQEMMGDYYCYLKRHS
jgi:hypothetical protein